MSSIPLFNELTIETVGSCNRTCPTCLRQSYPNREAVSSRFDGFNRLPFDLYQRIIDEVRTFRPGCRINLQFFNEPLMDRRLPEYAAYAQGKGFEMVRIYSNMDLITQERAAELDPVIDSIVVSLYEAEPGGTPLKGTPLLERAALIRSWFKRTDVSFSTGDHITTHFSPREGLQEAIEEGRRHACIEDVLERIIIDHTGRMLMCCDDIGNEFNLGSVTESTLAELWFSPKHIALVQSLMMPGGRRLHSYCWNCPRW
jgi:radical SAM protein with 4Fe4S-binding SPASM domain